MEKGMDMFGRFSTPKPIVDTPEKTGRIPDVTFDYKNSEHLDLVKEKMSQFSKLLHELQAIDYKIFMGAAISTGCYIGAYLFPLTLFSIGGACMASWNAAKREVVSAQYRDALNDLIEVYKWSMGKDSGYHWEKLAVNTLQDLILTLGPWVSNKTIHTWANTDLKPTMLSFSRRRSDIPEELERQLTQFAANMQAAQWAYRLYGEHGVEKIFDAMQTNIKAQVNDLVVKTISPK